MCGFNLLCAEAGIFDSQLQSYSLRLYTIGLFNVHRSILRRSPTLATRANIEIRSLLSVEKFICDLEHVADDKSYESPACTMGERSVRATRRTNKHPKRGGRRVGVGRPSEHTHYYNFRAAYGLIYCHEVVV